MSNSVFHKIVLPEEMSLAEVQKALDKGAQFISFQYCISILFAVSLRRFSSAYLVFPRENRKKYAKKYNRLTSIFGWWAIPWGPYYSIKFLQANNAGGHDITGDISVNLTEENVKSKQVEIKFVDKVFIEPQKVFMDGYRKTLIPNLQSDMQMQSMYVGLFVNVEENENPYNVIGFRSKLDTEDAIDRIEKELYKEFKNRVEFVFFDLNKDDEINERLMKQCVKLF